MAWLELLKDIPLTAVVKERLAHEEKLHEETKAKNAELRLHVEELTKEVARLTAELSGGKVPDEFREQDGKLWKKTGEGPFCVKCKGTLTRLGPMHFCPRCDN